MASALYGLAGLFAVVGLVAALVNIESSAATAWYVAAGTAVLVAQLAGLGYLCEMAREIRDALAADDEPAA